MSNYNTSLALMSTHVLKYLEYEVMLLRYFDMLSIDNEINLGNFLTKYKKQAT